jgi:ATP-dependent Clp protease ATP-binding subunit ClpC
MYERFTDRTRKVMHLANDEAKRFNHEFIGTEHILLGLVKDGSGVAANVLKNLDIDLRKVRQEVEKIVQPGPDRVSIGKLPQTPRAKKVIEYSIEEARNLNHNYVGTEHLLLGLLREQEGVGAQILINLGLNLEDMREEVLNLLGHDMDWGTSSGDPGSAERPRTKNMGRPLLKNTAGDTPTVDCFAQDLTELARLGKLGPIIGRKNEIERLFLVLCCRTQTNPLLVGEAGVGKTAIVHGFAQWSGEPYQPKLVRNYRIMVWNLAQMVAFLNTRRPPQRTIETMMDEIRKAKNTFLFIPDVHILAGPHTGRLGNYAFSLVRRTLARGDLRCIGTATPEKYQSVLAGDRILGRHFRPIFVQPATREETVAILHSRRGLYEDHHRVHIDDDALQAAVEFSDDYLPDRGLPWKALLLLDEASALVRLRSIPPLPELVEMEQRIKNLVLEKEAAVAESDFEKAAQLLDQAYRLTKDREVLVRQWEEKCQELCGTVDKKAVAEIVSKVSGVPISGS